MQHTDNQTGEDEPHRCGVGKTREEQLLVSETVLVGNAAGILSRAGEHAAHLVPCLGAHIEHIARGDGIRHVAGKGRRPLGHSRNAGLHRLRNRGARHARRGRTRCTRHARRNGSLSGQSVLAVVELGAQPLGLGLGDVGHHDSLVRRASGRVDGNRTHAEQSLKERRPLVHGLHALVGHVHLLLVEDAGAQREFVGADGEVQMLVANDAQPGDDAKRKKDDHQRADAGHRHDEPGLGAHALFGNEPNDGGEVRHHNAYGNDEDRAHAFEPDVAVVHMVAR